MMTADNRADVAAGCQAGAAGAAPRERGELRRRFEQLGAIAEAIAALLVLLVALLIGYEVIARYLFGQPTGFANQAAAYAMPVIAFFAAGATLKRNAHVAVDALIDALGESARLRLTVANEFLGLVAVVLITRACLMEVIDNYETGTRSFSTVITFPEYIPQIAMPVGLLILAGFQFLRFADALRENASVRRNRGESNQNEVPKG